jgi:hypothetical protein
MVPAFEFFMRMRFLTKRTATDIAGHVTNDGAGISINCHRGKSIEILAGQAFKTIAAPAPASTRMLGLC